MTTIDDGRAAAGPGPRTDGLREARPADGGAPRAAPAEPGTAHVRAMEALEFCLRRYDGTLRRLAR